MRSKREQRPPLESPAYREMQVLSEIENDPEITQRELSNRLGVALGLTNVIIRTLVQKGFVRANKAGWKRWLYALTPEGFSHKIQLTAAYVGRFLDHYRRVRQTLREELLPLALHEESRVAIYGTGEFAELVYLGLKELGLNEMEIFDSASTANQRFMGMPVREITSLRIDDYDRVFLANLNGVPECLTETLKDEDSQDKVVGFFANGKTQSGV